MHQRLKFKTFSLNASLIITAIGQRFHFAHLHNHDGGIPLFVLNIVRIEIRAVFSLFL